MGIDEIRAKAPDGATHYNQSEYYFKNIDLVNNTCEMYSDYSQSWFSTYVSVFDVFKPL